MATLGRPGELVMAIFGGENLTNFEPITLTLE